MENIKNPFVNGMKPAKSGETEIPISVYYVPEDKNHNLVYAEINKEDLVILDNVLLVALFLGKEGDNERTAVAAKLTVHANIWRTICFMVNKYSRLIPYVYGSREDACNELTCIVEKCMENFRNMIKNGFVKNWVDFATYCNTAIENQIWCDYRKRKKNEPYGGFVSFDEILEKSAEGEAVNKELLQAMEDKDSVPVDEIRYNDIRDFQENLGPELLEWFRSLKPVAQEIVYLRTVGYSFEKIAAAIGNGITVNCVKKTFYRCSAKYEKKHIERGGDNSAE